MLRRRAFSLAYILTLCALAFLLVGLAVTSGLQVHSREQALRNRQQAILYAKNGLERAIARLAEDQKWGQSTGDQLKVQPLAGHPEDAGALVTFDATDAYASVNRLNLESTASVPKNTVHLWSVGTYRGAKVRIEASVAKPAFPFAIASSGPITTRGDFFAGTIDNPDDADLELSSAAFLQHLKQASLLSNGTRVSLQEGHITGDVVSAGTIDPGPKVVVDGQKREHSSPKPMPVFDLNALDTRGKPLLNELPSGDLRRSQPLIGYARCAGNLVVMDPLNLEEAILFVDGDLTVKGKLSGKGAVFARGTITVESTALGAIDEVALIAGSDLTVSGLGKTRSKVVGLLASGGNLHLSNITVVGAVICSGTGAQALTLDNVNVLGSPKGLQFEFDVAWGVATTYNATPDPTTGSPGGLVRLAQVVDPATGVKRDAVPADSVTRYDPQNPDALLLREGDFQVLAPDGSVQSLSQAGIAFGTNRIDNFRGILNDFARQQANVNTAAVAHGKFSLDLNRFLRLGGDSLQVVYRRID